MPRAIPETMAMPQAERQRDMYSATDLPWLVALRDPTTAKPGDCNSDRSPRQ